LALEIAKKVILASEMQEWESVATKVVKNFSELLNLSVKSEIDTISADHALSEYPSALLYHSLKYGQE
jgi:hypothetical protein